MNGKGGKQARPWLSFPFFCFLLLSFAFFCFLLLSFAVFCFAFAYNGDGASWDSRRRADAHGLESW